MLSFLKKVNIFSVLISSLTLLIGCLAPPTEDACHINTLLLYSSSFPADMWEEIGSRDLQGAPSKLGIERAGTSFSTPTQGVAVHIIYKFSTIAEANEKYPQLESSWFNLTPEGSILLSPIELQNLNLNSDNHKLDCSMKAIERCQFVAQYGNYIVEFKTDMPALTYSDLIHLLNEIDLNMLKCINK